jgi:hypothetical protein
MAPADLNCPIKPAIQLTHSHLAGILKRPAKQRPGQGSTLTVVQLQQHKDKQGAAGSSGEFSLNESR